MPDMPLPPGTRFGSFEIVRSIGAGGMGEVYLARDAKLDPKSPKLLLDTQEAVDEAHFSPDGKWIAYQVTEANAFDVWVASFPGFDQRRRISSQSGGQPFWRGDGKELFYLSRTGQLMSVRVDRNAATGALDYSAPSLLFQSPLASPTLTIDQYAPSSDGQRFLFIRPRQATGAKAQMLVIANWMTGLGAR